MIQYRANGITVFQSALYETTSTVLVTSSFVLIVDPTWLPSEVEEIRQYVTSIRVDRPVYLLFTHSDWDHILGYKAFPDAITIGSYELNNHPDKKGIIHQILTYDSRNYHRRNYEIVYPSIDIMITNDGQELRIGDSKLTFYLAPGHTSCGIFCIVETHGLFIAGDYLSNIEFPYIYFNSQAYEETLKKIHVILRKHNIDVLVPGHGQYTTEVKEIMHRQQRSLRYIQTLRELLKADRQEDIERMLDEYEFPLGMKQYHQDNQTQIKTELGIQSLALH